ncbi:MAG: hypothetical protein SGILL_004586 [Bacillariaceae sp.]
MDRKAGERGGTRMSGMDADGDNNDRGGDVGDGKDLQQAANARLGKMTLGFKNFMNNQRQQGQGGAGGGIDMKTGKPLSDGVVGIFGGKRVTRWPYDDYHQVQQQFYMKLEEMGSIGMTENGGGGGGGLNGGQGGEEEKTASTGAGAAAAGLWQGINAKIGGGGGAAASSTASSAAASSGSKALQRPADPKDIPTAVLGLPLSDFERKAEERSIAIVSTWLFDCGLIDELLVHGGMGKSTMQAVKTSNVSTTAQQTDSSSIPSQEGIEIGTFAHTPIEGPSKMDKEIAKLRGGTARQLALVNSRLNDGVAASGGEVQELVNAVNSTKDDLGRLRELSTYISNTGDVQSTRSQTFMLTRYPKLKKAINARRNLARCFRELDFYSQIPLTCDRLREELHSAEWTEVEWSSLREVSREHVELEIFLVEAEAGMKKRIDEEAEENQKSQAGLPQDPRRSSITSGNDRYQRHSSFIPKGGITNYEEVDNFLHEHVKNVWELGDEIRMRIMSGIGSAFELAMNNPVGLVALIEAVEVYETANEEYKTVHGEEAGGSNQNLRFTDMRASALKQMYQDFELRGLEIFREVHEVAQERGADEDEEAANDYFNSILRACNGLTGEISFVQNQMSPCFPEYWALEMLWSTCVAHVCSKQILDQIGGTEGHKLPDLSVTQLLDLVAWIETFRSTIEESFPNIGEHISKKTYFDKPPALLQEDNRNVDMDVAKDSLAWANNMLWEVHDLSKDEFLFRTKEQTNEWFDNVYEADHTKSQTSEGRLITSLGEDVYSVAGVQLRTIRERLTRRSEALVQSVGIIFKSLYEKQIAYRNNFLQDFETCCAAANDFIRMSEQCEEMIADLVAECNLTQEASDQLDEQASVLLGLYSGDAVFAAQKVHLYIFEPIDEAISEELFSSEWLDELTGNELALTLVKTLEDFMGDLEEFVDELMVGKTLDALVTATIIFYFKALLKKSAEHKNGKQSAWSNNARALERMKGDINTMREYFEELEDSYPTLKRVVPDQFEILDTVHELLSIAAGLSSSSDRDFVIVLQKRIRNIPITKLVVGDLWHLVNPQAEKSIYEKVDVMETELNAVAPNDPEAFDIALARQTVPGLRLDQELALLCDKNKRNRPGLSRTAAEQGQIMLSKWRETWQNMVEEMNED